MSDPIDLFKLAIAAAGLTPPDTINADGKLHRFSSNGKPRDDSGYYTLHLDGIAAGFFGCWRAGFSQNWCAKAEGTLTQAERDVHKGRIAAMQVQREAEQVQRQQHARDAVAVILDGASPARTHEYLTAKGIKPHGVKCDGVRLLIPMRDTAGTVHSLQTIAPDGDKRFHYGGAITGNYFSIGKPDGLVIVCEGFATGASIRESTGHAVAVAFNAGNLQPVAVALHAKYPALKIIIAADDDYLTEGNPGLTKARAAAQAVAGLVAVPDFGSDRPGKATDFNDLHQIAGPDAVKRCIDAAAAVEVLDTVEAGAGNLSERTRSTAVVLTCGSDLTPEPVQWLWPDWLALGKFHLLAGAPGQGKTTIAMGMAATVTVGGRWPDGSRCAMGNVLIWSGEDDYTDTLLPRLIAAGADKSRVFFVDGTRVGGVVRPFDPSVDTRTLQEAIQKIGSVRLIIIDPVSTAVAGDSHKNTEVRRGLQPLVDLATAINAALLGITHLSKGGQGSDPAQRVIGSIAFTAVARVVLVAAKVNSEDGEDRRILARGKSNIGPDNGGFEYHLVQVQALPGIDASRIEWGQAVQGTARELLTDPEGQDGNGEDKSAVDAAADFVRQVLADGQTPAKTVKEDATDAGVSWASVRRAADNLQVIKTKGAGGAWYLKLAQNTRQDVQGAQGAQPLNLEHLEHVEHLDPESAAGAVTDAEDAEVF